jgi:hypothetical protein
LYLDISHALQFPPCIQTLKQIISRWKVIHKIGKTIALKAMLILF